MCYRQGQGCHPEGSQRLEERANRNLTKHKKENCEVHHLNRLTPAMVQAGDCLPGSNSVEKDLTVLVDSRLQISHQSPSFVVMKANSIMGYINRSAASRLREVIIPLYLMLPVSGTLCPVLGPPGVMLMNLSEFNRNESPTKMVSNGSTCTVRRV